MVAFYQLVLWLCAASFCRAQDSILTTVDDSEVYLPSNPNGIQYSNDWARILPPNSDGRYKNTISVTSTVGASAVYFFKGTSIKYYSDMSPDLANMIITLDGRNSSPVNSAQAPAYQKLLWSQENLDDGDHQLVVSLGSSNKGGNSASLDYLEITHSGDMRPLNLGPGATASDTSGVIVDDSDPSIIYEGSWSVMESAAPYSHYFSNSQHSTTVLGDSLTFKFTGTAIYYFTDRKKSNGRVSISVDGGEGNTVDTSLPDSVDSSTWLQQALCWSKTGLSDGPHTIKLTHMGDSGMSVGLDFFKYTPSSKGGSRSTRLSAIIGGSVGGGLVLIVAALALCLVYRRRQYAKRFDPEQIDAIAQEPGNLAPHSMTETEIPYTGHQVEATDKSTTESIISGDGPSSRARMNSPIYHGLPEPHTT